MRQNSYPGKIIRILLLCLCAALLAGTAAAEGVADLSDAVTPCRTAGFCWPDMWKEPGKTLSRSCCA